MSKEDEKYKKTIVWDSTFTITMRSKFIVDTGWFMERLQKLIQEHGESCRLIDSTISFSSGQIIIIDEK